MSLVVDVPYVRRNEPRRMLPCVGVAMVTAAPLPVSEFVPSVSCGTSPIEAGNVTDHV